jgi:hypothetical protein
VAKFEPRSHDLQLGYLSFKEHKTNYRAVVQKSTEKSEILGNYSSKWSRRRLRVGNPGLNLDVKSKARSFEVQYDHLR